MCNLFLCACFQNANSQQNTVAKNSTNLQKQQQQNLPTSTPANTAGGENKNTIAPMNPFLDPSKNRHRVSNPFLKKQQQQPSNPAPPPLRHHATRYEARGGNAPIWITRGCPYRCGICSAPFQNGRPVRAHSIDYMVRWVKYLYDKINIEQLNIIDDNFTYHIKYA